MSNQNTAEFYRTNLRGEIISINDRFLRPADVAEKCGLHRSSLYRLMGKGQFPKTHKISSGRVVWLEADIEEFMRLGGEKFQEIYGNKQVS